MKNSWYYEILLLFIIFFLLITTWFWDGLYGFDWTDTTYHFQQALNIYNGKILGADFRSHVPGLSFWIEAQFFKFFGAKFIVHRVLGLLFPFVAMTCLAIIISLSLKELRQQDRIAWVLALSSVAVTSVWGNQLYFNFTDLAGAISFLLAVLIFFSYQLKSRLMFLFLISLSLLLVSVQILVKQSHGLLNIILLIPFILFYFYSRDKSKFLPLLAVVTFLIFVVACIFYLESVFCSECMYKMIISSGGSLELKGLTLQKPLEVFLTMIGITELKHIIAFCVVASLSVFGIFLLQRYNYLIDNLFLVLPIFLFFLTKFSFLAIAAHYLSICFFVAQLLFFYKVISNRAPLAGDKHTMLVVAVFFAQFPLIGSILAEQLSWPGAYYIRPSLTIPLIIMQVLVFFLLFRLKVNSLIKPAVSLLLSIMISILLINPAPNRFDKIGEGLTKLEDIESFAGWKISPQTMYAIIELRDVSTNCPGEDLFQLAWMPIAYELTNRKNVTGYDLPYHDTINYDHAKHILLTLANNPPGMIIIQEKYANYQGPFPATGMKYLYENISELLNKYEFKSEVSDNHNQFKIYCYIS